MRTSRTGGSTMTLRRFLVIHFTDGATAESSISWWRNPDARGASAHIVIDRDRPQDPGAAVYTSNTALTRGKVGFTTETGQLGSDGVIDSLAELVRPGPLARSA